MENNENKNEQKSIKSLDQQNTESNPKQPQANNYNQNSEANPNVPVGENGLGVDNKVQNQHNEPLYTNKNVNNIQNANTDDISNGNTSSKKQNLPQNDVVPNLTNNNRLDSEKQEQKKEAKNLQNPNKETTQDSQQAKNDNSTILPTQNNQPNNIKQPNKKNNKGAENSSVQDGASNHNPSKKLPNIKKFSKHANGEDEQPQPKEKDRSKWRNNSLAKKVLGTENNDDHDEESGEEEQTGAQTLKDLINGVKRIITGITAFISAMPLVSTIALIIILVLVICIIIVPIIASLQPYGEDEDGNVCFATAPCTNIVLKNGDTEKKYKLDEYIAGAMVDYYDYSSVVKYTLGKPGINDNLLKALAVIIHTDISIYSSYDSQTSTCTIDDTSKFKNVYEPTVTDDNSDATDITDETENQETNQDSTEEQDSQNNVDTENDSNTNSENKQTKEDKYYYQAKSAVNSVLSEVVDAYSTNLELKYSGYLQVLHNAADAGQDYQKIVKTYIKNDPNYFSKTSATEDDEDQDNSAEDNSIGIYPICYFDKSSTGTGPISYSSDICSTVHINNGTNAGDYTIDEFIEGVVYNEARAWTDSLDTLKAHAVAARTYLVNRGKVENGTCYMTVGGNTMGFTKSTNAAIHQAVTETSGEYIMVNGQISKQAEWDALCITNPGTTGSTYTICQKNQQIPKEWFSKVKLFGTISWYNEHSHGRGMSQYGAYYLATVQGKSYKDIINYYYGAEVGTVITQSKEGFVMPINTFSKITGETTGYCGSGKPHTGIDFAAPTGTPIYAAHDGVIVKTYDNGTNCYGSCNSTQAVGIGFRIDNQDGTISMYMHMSKRENLSKGTSVKAGQLLGYVGNTGSSTGPHLHYGMSNSTNGAVLNPRSYLPLDEKGFGKCYNYR